MKDVKQGIYMVFKGHPKICVNDNDSMYSTIDLADSI